MLRHIYLSIVFSSIFLGFFEPAHADETFPGIQFVCAPQINYFSATTIRLDDINPKSLQRSSALTIMNIADLDSHPYICRWGKNSIQVQLTYYHEAQDRGYCGAVEYGNMEITWNGNKVAKIEQDHCGSDGHTVTVADLNYHGPASFNLGNNIASEEQPKLYVTHCSSTSDQNGVFNCENHYFDTSTKTLR